MIDKNIKEKMSNFYNERYIFEVFLNETGKATLSIEKNIVDISKRNNEQGVSGHYYGYATNPYSIIKYTLIENKEILNQKYVKDILYVIKETLFSETQTLNEKISAFKLLTFLRITYENYEVLFDEFNEEIIGKEDITLRGKEILIEKSSHLIMNLIYFLYILSCGIEQNSKVVSICSSFAESKDFERLEAAYILHEYFGLKDTNTISYNDLYPILSMLLYFCHDIQHSVRYYAIYALINMLSQRTFSPIVYQLSNSMDFESLAIKKLILQHKDDISKFDKTISEGILQKAKADTNYIIKMVVQNL